MIFNNCFFPFADDAKQERHLDVDLRHLLLKYLNRIEINFRTKVVYFILDTISENRAKDMKSEINKLFDKFNNSLIINGII